MPIGLPLGKEKMGMAAAHYQRQHGKLQLAIAILPFFQQHSVNVSLQMVHANKRLVESVRQRLGVAEAHQQCAGKTRAFGYRQARRCSRTSG